MYIISKHKEEFEMHIYDESTGEIYTSHEDVMKRAAYAARLGVNHKLGGPFGAAITRGDLLISVACNTVLAAHDPTAHAEINAIRLACKSLKTHDLSGYTLYATGAPCPMCLAAIIWSNIKTIYVSGLAVDAADIGFRDYEMYRYIKSNDPDPSILDIKMIDRQIAVDLYKDYAAEHGTMY